MDALHTSFFNMFSITFSNPAQARNKSSYPVPLHFEFCTCSHLLKPSVTWSSLPNPFPQIASLRAPKRWKSEIWAVWWVEVNSPSEFYDWFLCFHAMAMYCHAEGGFQQHLCEVELSRNTSARFEESDCTHDFVV